MHLHTLTAGNLRRGIEFSVLKKHKGFAHRRLCSHDPWGKRSRRPLIFPLPTLVQQKPHTLRIEQDPQ